MYNDTGQFGSFCGLDNRRELYILFERLGKHLLPFQADNLRAVFLRELIRHSEGPMVAASMKVSPCNAIEAFGMCREICGVLGVPIETAAKLLDEVVRKQDDRRVVILG